MSTPFPPLTARSILLSVLLGTHPPALPVRALVRTAALFGVSEGTARVALSRLAADGEVIGEGAVYRLSGRLLDRQNEQDSSLRPATSRWRGTWEVAIAERGASTSAERESLGAQLGRLGLAELRPGVWVRPANLAREWPSALRLQALLVEARSSPNGAPLSDLVPRLWDLGGWASEADRLIEALQQEDSPAGRFVTAAAMVRHLRSDPVLPRSLLPRRWPGNRLRASYGDYQRELLALLQRELD